MLGLTLDDGIQISKAPFSLQISYALGEGLTLREALDDVDQDDLPREVQLREALGKRPPDIPGAEDRDLIQQTHANPALAGPTPSAA